MNKPAIAVGASLLATFATAACGDVTGFDSDAAGGLPAGWVSGVTGKGSAHWVVEADPSAPSRPGPSTR